MRWIFDFLLYLEAFGVLPKLGSQPHDRGANVGSLLLNFLHSRNLEEVFYTFDTPPLFPCDYID